MLPQRFDAWFLLTHSSTKTIETIETQNDWKFVSFEVKSTFLKLLAALEVSYVFRHSIPIFL